MPSKRFLWTAQLLGKVPLRVLLVVPFVVLISTTVGVTGWLSLNNGQRAVNEVASEVRSEITARIQEVVESHLAIPHLVNQLNANAVLMGELDLHEIENRERHFWQQMHTFPMIYSNFFGRQNGEFFGVSRHKDDELAMMVGEFGHLTYYTADATGQRTAHIIRPTRDFDVASRPWFQDAIKAGQAVWSKIYADISTQELQITAAQPLFTAENQLSGVLGSSFFFTQINQFLRSLHIGKTGQTFIIERDGNLVTASTDAPLIYIGNDKKDNRIKAIDSESLLISHTARYLTEVANFTEIQQTQQLDFSIQGKRQFVQVTPLQDKWGLDWLIVVVVPEADFMQQIEKNTQVTILLSIAGLLLAILLGILTANSITRPLQVLVVAAHTMASGKLDQRVKLSRLKELAALGRSFNQMAQQLQGSFTALEKINEVLEQRVIERTAELQKTAAELRALFSAMTELIFVYDTQGRYLKIAPTNPLAIYKPSNHLLGKTLHEVLPLAQADTFLQYIHQVTETQQTFNVEYNLKIVEREFWFSASISPITRDSVVWVARDITEKKKAESELLLEQEKSERLLLNILPKAIAEQLKQSHSAIAEHFDEVTIMFADIVDFTPLSARLSPQELVESLNRIFSTFDQLVERYDLEKIKTIGDAYMVAGGLPIPNDTHAENIVEMALEMQDKILDLQTITGEQFQIRIGINTGPVVAGVIGIKKFIYDLWGDTVNVASRMESRGAPGCIQVTERTYQILKNKYIFEQRGIIHVKGKGEMMTYWLKGRNPQSSAAQAQQIVA